MMCGTRLAGERGRASGGAWTLTLALLIGACAADNAALTANPGPVGETALSRGTILAMRPVRPGVAPAYAGAGAAVLANLARTADPGVTRKDVESPGSSMDFVVREAGGATIAVVQSNEQNFRVGDQVSVVRGDHTRLSRPGA